MPIDLESPSTAPGEVRRDRWGRPYITPPDGGKAKPYTRCTTFVSCLEDLYNLQRWQMRQVAIGLSGRKDLLLSVAANLDNKQGLDELCERAMEAANAHSARDTGTALHALCEQLDRGTLDLSRVPDEYRPDVLAYQRATAGWEHVHIERMTVHDHLQVAGTPDRIVRIGGRDYIADIKTGSVDYGQLKIAMQLAMYSRSALYDHATGVRTPLDVRQDRGIVIHLPAGTGECTLHWVDLAAGWDAVQTAADVRTWRKRRGLFSSYSEPTPTLLDTTIDEAAIVFDPVAFDLRSSDTVGGLVVVWQIATAAGTWREEHTRIAADCKADLLAAGATA